MDTTIVTIAWRKSARFPARTASAAKVFGSMPADGTDEMYISDTQTEVKKRVGNQARLGVSAGSQM
jgi:hypothetical protein